MDFKEPVGTPEQRHRARELTLDLVQKYDRSLSFVELERAFKEEGLVL
jgi:hypothetical protein